ncbi:MULTISPECIES: PspC domain-containing protein [Paenibacillus]|uniref:PspC domain-containing protein n=1 Tax=Paenibacillus TaxID=44249 RepID=UPI002FE2B862
MRKLYRSVTDKQISGLCGGLARFLGMDPTIVRLIAVVVALCSVGSAVALYLIASLIVPKEPIGEFGFDEPFTHY